MFARLISLLNLRKGPHFRRWSQEQLFARKTYLKTKQAEHWTLEDWELAAEYIIQRYLPKDYIPSELQWKRWKGETRAKIKANLDRTKTGQPAEKPRWAEINRRNDEIRELLRSSYSLSDADFRQFIHPLLAKFPSDGAPETRTQLRRNYEVLRRAQNAGCIEVRLWVRDKCRCLHDLLDGKVISVRELLSAFEGRNDSLPLIPPIETPCAKTEDHRICDVYIDPVPPPTPGDDPDFARNMDRLLDSGRGPKTIPANWRELLNKAASRAI